MLFQAVLGNLERKRFSPCGQHSRSVVQLFSLRKFTNHFEKLNQTLILFIMLNVQKVSAQKTILEKRHKDCQKEYLIIMVEMLIPIS